jgi:hypothetical protein
MEAGPSKINKESYVKCTKMAILERPPKQMAKWQNGKNGKKYIYIVYCAMENLDRKIQFMK